MSDKLRFLVFDGEHELNKEDTYISALLKDLNVKKQLRNVTELFLETLFIFK